MASETHPFYAIFASEYMREQLFVHLSKADISSVRLASSACCNIVTRRLFQRVHLTFTPNSFTKQSRIQALSRIGHHIEHLTFYLPHSEATFLPPLIHPQSGSELSYLYTPHTSMTSTLTRPKYGTSELGDILTQQYPPLFHAATNVPSFINALKNITNLRHLTIKTPGQDARERYRRDIVDYALISLRIAIERINGFTKLSRLSLSGVHPAAFLYLRYEGGPGFGCTPSAARRWRQIRRLNVSVEAWDFYGPSGPGLDQLRIINDYLRNFSETVEKLSFTWIGNKGPCPLALSEDPLFDTPMESKKVFNEYLTPLSPTAPPPPGMRRPIRFSKLRYLQIKNASMNEMQLRGLVESHKETVKEFDFENVVLINGGNWDEALAPLMAPSESFKGGKPRTHTWSRQSIGIGSEPPKTPSSPHGTFKTMAPRSSPNGSLKTVRTRGSITEDEIEIKHTSAAVEAVGRDLMDEHEGLEAFAGLSQTSSQSVHSPWEEKDEIMFSLDSEFGEELEHTITTATSLASMTTDGSFSAKLTKKRAHKRIRKPWHPKRGDGEHSEEEHSQPSQSSQSNSQEELKEERSLTNLLHHKRSNSSSHSNKHERNLLARRSRQSSDPMPYTSCQILDSKSYELQLPDVIGSDDETPCPVDDPSTPRLSHLLSHPLPPVPLNISAPLPAEQLPVLLQPSVYNPAAYNPQTSTASIPIMVQASSSGGSIASGVSGSTTLVPSPHHSHAHHNNNGNGHNLNEGLSGVQRNLEQEELQRRFAEDAEARVTALQKARDAVLRKMGKLNAANALNKVDEGPRLDEHPALQQLQRKNSYGRGRDRDRDRERDKRDQRDQRDQQNHQSSSSADQGGGSRVHLRIRELLGGKDHREMYQSIEGSNSLVVPLVFSGN